MAFPVQTQRRKESLEDVSSFLMRIRHTSIKYSRLNYFVSGAMSLRFHTEAYVIIYLTMFFLRTWEYFIFLWTLDQKCAFPFILMVLGLLGMLERNSENTIRAL